MLSIPNAPSGLCVLAAALLAPCAFGQNPDRGYNADQRLNLADLGGFAVDSYVEPATNGTGPHAILYAGDFRGGNTVWRIAPGSPAVVTLVASGFGSGSLSIGDLVVDRARHLVYVHDTSHGAIYELDPKVTPTTVRAIAADPEWVTAFGNGGIDINPADGQLYLLTPGNAATGGGGIYRIDLDTGTFQVTRLLGDVAGLFAPLGRDVRPDVIRFDCLGRLWGSARDLGDLGNRPSIIYRLPPPFTSGASLQVVLEDPNIGTVADLEFDPMTDDLFIAATEIEAVLRFNVDWFDYDGTRSVVDFVSSFGAKVQGIALGSCWNSRGGNSLFVATNASSHLSRRIEPTSLYETGPLFVTADGSMKRCSAPNDCSARMRGTVPGMLGWSLATDPVQTRLFLLGKTPGNLDVQPGIYRLDSKVLNQVFTTDFVGVALNNGSGYSGRGDLVFSPWLYEDPVDAYPQPLRNDVFRVYARDEADGVILAANPDLANTEVPPALHYRPEPDDTGAQFYQRTGPGAMAIGPDQGLWVMTKNPATNEVGIDRLLRQNYTDKPLVEIEAVGSDSGTPDLDRGFWRITHNMGTPADRGSPIVEVVLDFAGSNNPAHASMVFDTDQPGMGDTFDAGNHNVAGCRGTYRHGSDVATGLVYDLNNTPPRTPCAAGANTGWIGTNPQLPGEYRTLRFRFAPGQFADETFAFDCDTDYAPGSGGDMAGLFVKVTLQDGIVLQGRMVADPMHPERSVARFTDQVFLDHFTPRTPLVLGASEVVDKVEVSWLGTIYFLVGDPNAGVSKLMQFDPVHGTTQLLHTMNERVNDFTLYETLDTGPMQGLHLGPQYFLFASPQGRITKWNPATNQETLFVNGFRFPVTSLAFGQPWHASGDSSLFVMLGVDNPMFAELFELGTSDVLTSFAGPQRTASLLPQGTRGAGGYVPFLRVEGLPQTGYARDYVVRWIDPDGFGIGGAAGSLVLLAGGVTRFPGDVYIPDLYVPLSMFPFGVFSGLAFDPAGPSALPGAGVARINITAPPGVHGDFTIQAAILDLDLGQSIDNTWTLTNALRIVF